MIVKPGMGVKCNRNCVYEMHTVHSYNKNERGHFGELGAEGMKKLK
jgi:hypothetical protein